MRLLDPPRGLTVDGVGGEWNEEFQSVQVLLRTCAQEYCTRNQLC